ncbi:uncharacterized protein EI90DRAFT_3127771 [Cantharellus anzutake]|uniref:uncharacterized protein n=1 Tax=Cantharellus anzutake TaxID=1750568 RepID=UPI001903989D|nr:uncharacterized protein EI90DRAFT_3127771 [Cantharellus anzutake]KAF8326575.1 hypothetical protein EI90DRAFT_3127771 [Cantharellus anzutake]
MPHAPYDQWKLVDDQFIESQEATTKLREWVTAYVGELSTEKKFRSETVAWVLRSLDTPSLFRLYKRKKFSIPLTQEALKQNILWRIETFPSLPTLCASSVMRFVPPSSSSSSTDRFGRPILVVRARYLSGQTVEGLKNQVLSMYELARLHIADLFHQSGVTGGKRVLQFVVIIDLQSLAIRDVPMDMVTWFRSVPNVHYPGMCAGCYVLNFSWAFNGTWSILKRVLPERAIARVFFPKQSELLKSLPGSSLPQEYGGELPALDEERDVLMGSYVSELPTSSDDSSSEDDSSLASSSTAVTSTSYTRATKKRVDLAPSPTLPSSAATPSDFPSSVLPPPIPIPSRSPYNSFFGYPVHFTSSSTNSIPRLSYGRRRKRDLARTLLILYFRRISLILQRTLHFLVPLSKRSATNAPNYYYYYDHTATNYNNNDGEIKKSSKTVGGIRLSLWFWGSLIAWLAGSIGKIVWMLRIGRGTSIGQAFITALKDVVPSLISVIEGIAVQMPSGTKTMVGSGTSLISF